MVLTVEFGGGLELLCDSAISHNVNVDPQNGADKLTVRDLLVWTKNLIKERPEMFIKGDTVEDGCYGIVALRGSNAIDALLHHCIIHMRNWKKAQSSVLQRRIPILEEFLDPENAFRATKRRYLLLTAKKLISSLHTREFSSRNSELY